LLDPLDRAIEVLLQLRGELLAGRLVFGVGTVAERLPDVVHPRDIVGTASLEQAQQEVGDAPRRGRVIAAARGEGARDHREESAVDESVSVDQVERRHGAKNNAGGEARENQKPRPTSAGGGDAEWRGGRLG